MINKRKPFKIVALVAAAIMIFTCNAIAIATLMTSSEVAYRLGQKELVPFFEENYFEPITVKGEVYSVTFMGMAPGEAFFAYQEGGDLVSENRTYAVIAVYRNDYEPLDQVAGTPIQVIPVIDGYRPDALFSMGMSATGFEKDGVLYYILDYTDLEVFAHKNVKLVAFEGMFPTVNILTANYNGEVVYAESYDGFKAVFELDLDESNADPVKAEELLQIK